MTFDEFRTKLAGKAAAVARLLQTEDGKVLLAALDETFVNVELRGPTDSETNFRLGQRAAVLYIHKLAQFNERTGKHDG